MVAVERGRVIGNCAGCVYDSTDTQVGLPGVPSTSPAFPAQKSPCSREGWTVAPLKKVGIHRSRCCHSSAASRSPYWQRKCVIKCGCVLSYILLNHIQLPPQPHLTVELLRIISCSFHGRTPSIKLTTQSPLHSLGMGSSPQLVSQLNPNCSTNSPSPSLALPLARLWRCSLLGDTASLTLSEPAPQGTWQAVGRGQLAGLADQRG